MALAWFDTDPLSMEEPVLRTGGPPILSPEHEWPLCPEHHKPMLFRTQIPFAITGMGSFDDKRLISVFECHASEHSHEPCGEGKVLISEGQMSVRRPPSDSQWMVFLTDYGSHPNQVRSVLGSLRPSIFPIPVSEDLHKPIAIIGKTSEEIAKQAAKELNNAGASTRVRRESPMILQEVHGGILAPYAEDTEAPVPIPLPSLSIIKSSLGGATLRGLVGAWVPSQLFDEEVSSCGKPYKTVVQLLGCPANASGDPDLNPAIVRVCKKGCDGKIYFD